MHIESDGLPRHNGEETYIAEFELKGYGDQFDTPCNGVQVDFRPLRVKMIWVRYLGVANDSYGPWNRVLLGYRGGSRISGPRILKDGSTSARITGYTSIFRASPLGSELTVYAASIPHLPALVAELERKLPA